MCELCSTNPKELESARQGAIRMAERLERAAIIYRGLGNGTIKPHTKEFIQKVDLFKMIIRDFVADYV